MHLPLDLRGDAYRYKKIVVIAIAHHELKN
jgi:hypothetical protein